MASARYLIRTAPLVLTLAGCHGSLGPGVAAYDQGRYPEAMRELEAAEPDLAGAEPEEATRYALYRGLAHLAVGNAPRAEPWLARARAALARGPLLLSAAERGRLHAAWRSMGHMPGDVITLPRASVTLSVNSNGTTAR